MKINFTRDNGPVDEIIDQLMEAAEDIRNAIAYHHRPDRLPDKTATMPWIVHLADQGCLMLGIGRGADGLAYDGMDGALSRLGLSQQDFEESLAQLVKEMDTAREMIGIVQPAAN
jgi:hypothetical protein